MRFKTRVLAIAILAAFGCMIETVAKDSSGEFTMRDADTRVGSLFKDVIITSSIPLDKPYEDLTDDQKQIIRSQYEAMHPLDEPPFPKKGLGPLYLALQKGATAFQVRGELSVLISIDSSGKATSAKLLKSPDPDFGAFAMKAAILTEYKSAKCVGVPCSMDFPIYLSFAAR